MNEHIRDAFPLFRSQMSDEKPTSPTSMIVLPCKVQKACQLNQIWHSRFPLIDWSNVVRNRDYACFLAEHNGIAYAVAIWSSPVAANRLNDGEFILELRRMAICNESPKNTASWMIAKMIKIIKKQMPHIKKLISYQDTESHFGTIYKASNWKPVETGKAISWTTKTRERNKEQSMSVKIRWEYAI